MTSRSKHQKIVHETLSRFKEAGLRSSSGELVTDRKQALAIALQTAERLAPAQAAGRGRARKQSSESRQLQLLELGPPPSSDHAWLYAGQEQRRPHAALFLCKNCPARRRDVQRFKKTLTLYAKRDGEDFIGILPPCASPRQEAAP